MKTLPPLNPRAQKSARQKTGPFTVRFSFCVHTSFLCLFAKSPFFFLPQTPLTCLCGWPSARTVLPGAPLLICWSCRNDVPFATSLYLHWLFLIRTFKFTQSLCEHLWGSSNLEKPNSWYLLLTQVPWICASGKWQQAKSIVFGAVNMPQK